MKHASLLSLAFVILITGCETKKEERVVAMPSSAPPVQAEKVTDVDPPFQPCLAIHRSNEVELSIDGLKIMHRLMDCAQSYLGHYPDGPNVNDAEKLERMTAVASMKILAKLNEAASKSADANVSGISAQDKLMMREELQTLDRANFNYLDRAVHLETIQIFRTVFKDLKAEGYKMGDAVKAQEAINRRFVSQAYGSCLCKLKNKKTSSSLCLQLSLGCQGRSFSSRGMVRSNLPSSFRIRTLSLLASFARTAV
jgi:hypothetical protein